MCINTCTKCMCVHVLVIEQVTVKVHVEKNNYELFCLLSLNNFKATHSY